MVVWLSARMQTLRRPER